MNFHNVNLPKFIEIFAVGGPVFSSSHASTISGREVINLDREYAKNKYLIKNCKLSELEFEQFNAFFRARKGQNYTFRFRDYADCKVVKQVIAVGDANTKIYHLFKLYDDPISPYLRFINKPVQVSLKLLLNGEPFEAVVDYDKGLIVLENALSQDQTLVASFTFDLMVRFCSDSFEYNLADDGTFELLNLSLIEVS
jgi:uncharacterized protein (TIGR02217 family)